MSSAGDLGRRQVDRGRDRCSVLTDGTLRVRGRAEAGRRLLAGRRSRAASRRRLARVAPPADLREWIALLEREGELVRVAAEVDPHLEITEIVDRTVKAGGPALLFENAKGSEPPAADQPVRHRAAHVPRASASSGSTTSRRSSRTCSRCSRRRASSRRCGAREAEVDRRLAAEDASAAAPCQEVVLTGDDVDLGPLPIQTCWPGDAAPFITLPAVITRDPRTGSAQRRHVPHAGARPRARRRCTGRSTRTAARTTSRPRGGSRSRSRSGSTRSRLLRDARRCRSTSTS